MSSDVTALLALGESNTLEFKQALHDLSNNNGKGEFVRDVLALANCTTPDSGSALVLGVQDQRHGGRVLGLASPLNAEQVAQILTEYCEPVPGIHVENVQYRRKQIGVVRVSWTEMFPYFARRDLGSSLIGGAGYTRRDSVVGRLTPPEIEFLFRAKAARLGPAITQEPIECGFVNYGHYMGPSGPILRIANVSDAVVQDVRVIFDVVWKVDPTVCRRESPAFEGPLEAGESREIELRLSTVYLATRDGKVIGQAHDAPKWLDVTAHVAYRNRHGLMGEVQAHTIVVD